MLILDSCFSWKDRCSHANNEHKPDKLQYYTFIFLNSPENWGHKEHEWIKFEKVMNSSRSLKTPAVAFIKASRAVVRRNQLNFNVLLMATCRLYWLIEILRVSVTWNLYSPINSSLWVFSEHMSNYNATKSGRVDRVPCSLRNRSSPLVRLRLIKH